MAYVYQADKWCDDCGKAIAHRLIDEGESPDDPGDESSFDSGDFPKGPYPDDDPADSPYHCGAGDDCLDPIELSNGRKVGAIVSGLTEDGKKYALNKIREKPDDPLMELWLEHFELELEEVQ